MFVCDLLDFASQMERASSKSRRHISVAFLDHAPGHSVSTGGLIFGVADAFDRDFNHVASFATAKG